MRPLIKALCSEHIDDSSYTQSVECLESLVNSSELRVDIDVCFGSDGNRDPAYYEEIEDRIWSELDEYMRAYEDTSDRHMALSKHANQLKALYARPGLISATSSIEIKATAKEKAAPNREL
jgi:hypothetical protein